jgi:two-component system chemotaxis sensor kinase CheA
MEIVREAISTLAGDLSVKTERGVGTTLELIVPLSVSSADVLHVVSAGMNATIPLSAIRHALRVGPGDIHRTGGGECIQHVGASIPLVALARLLGGTTQAARAGPRSAVVLGAAAGTVAVSVDRMLATSSVVFRSVPDLAPVAPVVAGASLDVDGSPLLMLDTERLVELALRHTEPAEHGAAARRPVLVIDDSLTTRMLEQSILESAGYDVDVAVCAEEALERARTTDYALFLVDVEMPGMDGFTFVEHIRRDPKLHATPAILVTSLDTPEHKQRGREVGAQGYVVKSEFDQSALLSHIEQLVA